MFLCSYVPNFQISDLRFRSQISDLRSVGVLSSGGSGGGAAVLVVWCCVGGVGGVGDAGGLIPAAANTKRRMPLDRNWPEQPRPKVATKAKTTKKEK